MRSEVMLSVIVLRVNCQQQPTRSHTLQAARGRRMTAHTANVGKRHSPWKAFLRGIPALTVF